MNDKEMCYVTVTATTDAKDRYVLIFGEVGEELGLENIYAQKWQYSEFLPLLPEQQAVSDRINGGE